MKLLLLSSDVFLKFRILNFIWITQFNTLNYLDLNVVFRIYKCYYSKNNYISSILSNIMNCQIFKVINSKFANVEPFKLILGSVWEEVKMVPFRLVLKQTIYLSVIHQEPSSQILFIPTALCRVRPSVPPPFPVCSSLCSATQDLLCSLSLGRGPSSHL